MTSQEQIAELRGSFQAALSDGSQRLDELENLIRREGEIHLNDSNQRRLGVLRQELDVLGSEVGQVLGLIRFE